MNLPSVTTIVPLVNLQLRSRNRLTGIGYLCKPPEQLVFKCKFTVTAVTIISVIIIILFLFCLFSVFSVFVLFCVSFVCLFVCLFVIAL